MIGYFMFIYFLAGVSSFFGFRLITKLIIIGGTYLGVFMIFKENGLFIIVYNAMVIIAIIALLIWLLKAVIQGFRNANPPQDIDVGEFTFKSIKLGTIIAVYGLLMLFMGGSSDNEFGPLSIVTIFGNLGIIEGIIALLVVGVVLGAVAMFIKNIIIKYIYSIKDNKGAKASESFNKMFKIKLFNMIFPNEEVYTNLEIKRGAIKEFPNMDYERLPKEVTRVVCDNGINFSRDGKKWVLTGDGILDDYLPDED